MIPQCICLLISVSCLENRCNIFCVFLPNQYTQLSSFLRNSGSTRRSGGVWASSRPGCGSACLSLSPPGLSHTRRRGGRERRNTGRRFIVDAATASSGCARSASVLSAGFIISRVNARLYYFHGIFIIRLPGDFFVSNPHVIVWYTSWKDVAHHPFSLRDLLFICCPRAPLRLFFYLVTGLASHECLSLHEVQRFSLTSDYNFSPTDDFKHTRSTFFLPRPCLLLLLPFFHPVSRIVTLDFLWATRFDYFPSFFLSFVFVAPVDRL